MHFAGSHSNSLAFLLIVLIALIGDVIGHDHPRWPRERQILNPDVLDVAPRGLIFTHQHPFGKWRIAFDTPDPGGLPNIGASGPPKTLVWSNKPFEVTDGNGGIVTGWVDLSFEITDGQIITGWADVALGHTDGVGQPVTVSGKLSYVDLLEFSEDQRLGMVHVTHYMDIELVGPREQGIAGTAMIRLLGYSPLHVAYIQRLSDDDPFPQSPFYYVNTRICEGRDADALFAAMIAGESEEAQRQRRERREQRATRLAEIERRGRHL